MRRRPFTLTWTALGIAVGGTLLILGVRPQGPSQVAWAATYLAAGTSPSGAHPLAGADEPPYPHGAFRADCGMCHRPDSWKPARIGKEFDHERYGFALRGAHLAVPCRQCHASLDFATASTACSDCHSDVHQGEFGSDCSRCHGTRSFIDRGDQVRMHRLSRFPLSGAHSTLDCEECHTLQAGGALSYVKTPTQCDACHLDDFQAAKSPDHVAGGFSHDCTTCHGDQTWSRANFDHASTRFPLTGAHAATSCTSCHVGGNYTALPIECVACHQSDYDGTTNPAHRAGGFPTTCQDCHGTAGWDGAQFDHATTGFTLTGAHRTAQCLDCHVGGNFTGTSPLCVSCHQDDYNGTTDPAHQVAGFPTTCQDCHGTAGWDGAQFDHATTGFTLTGAHTTVRCLDCHVAGNFTNTSPLCKDCHLDDYNAAANPPHLSSGFPTTCEDCHGTITWTGAQFNHASTGFALTGAHTTAQCLDCHVGGNYTNTSPLCSSCHMADYTATTNPAHQAAGFPTTCDDCHSTTAWAGATFDHDTQWFPIYSGRHATEWNQCSDCHTSPTNFASFTCLTCHPHSDKLATDSHHTGQAGYRYDSAACYDCHPRGRT